MSNAALFKKHHEKVVVHSANAGGAAISFLGAAATGGVSLLHTAYSARQMSVVKQQRKVLEHILDERGLVKPRKRKRDKIGGAAIAVVTAGVGVAVGDVSSQLQSFF